MLIVHVEFEISPENSAKALAALRAEKPEVTALDGCSVYEIRVDPDHDGKITLWEEWDDSAAFIAYKSSPAFEKIGGLLFPMMVGKPTTRYYGPVEDPTEG